MFRLMMPKGGSVVVPLARRDVFVNKAIQNPESPWHGEGPGCNCGGSVKAYLFARAPPWISEIRMRRRHEKNSLKQWLEAYPVIRYLRKFDWDGLPEASQPSPVCSWMGLDRLFVKKF